MRFLSRGLLPLSLLALFSAFASAQQGPFPPEKALATMKVADGFQVELFAAEPMLFNPTSMDVDHKGRVWVAEAVNYRRKGFGRPIIRKEGDRIVVLIDAKGEGKASESKVFYQGEEIYGPLGVCVAPYADGKGQKVFVCQSPDILVFEDKDGDLKADGPPKKFLTGFGGFDHDHGVHGINIGPDGKLYFTVGDSGVTALQSSDKKGPVWKSNTTDVHKGTVWRCDMDGTNLELIAHNFRNNYECCVDSFGEIWLSDNDDDGNQQTRICFVMPGGNYGYGPRGAGQTHWHEEQPGIVHKTLRTGFGSPTGITFNEGTLFGTRYRGSLLHCDAGPREVRWFHRKPKGAGYELEKELLLTSTDNWFRPSDVCIAPDGSIFVADWYDKGVGGHAMNDPQDGRIYRITPKGHKGYTVPEVKLDTKEGKVAALMSPNAAVRHLLTQRLQTEIRGNRAEAVIIEYMEEFAQKLASVDRKNQVERQYRMARWTATAQAVDWSGFVVNGENTGGFEMVLLGMLAEIAFQDEAKRDPRLRELLVRVLSNSKLGTKARDALLDIANEAWRDNPPGIFAPAHQALRDAPAGYRRELLLALRNVEAAKAGPAILNLAHSYDGQDIFYRAALNIACGTDPARRDAILADFDKHFPEWNDKVADLVWELRPKSVLPRLGKLLADAKLTAMQKARIIDIIAANDDPAAGQSMLAVLSSDAAPEVKARAIDSLKLFLPTKWKGLQGSKELGEAIDKLLGAAGNRKFGLQLIAAADSAGHLDAVARIATDAKEFGDIRHEAVRSLGKLKSVKSVETLAKLVAETDQTPPLIASDVVAALAEQITNQPKNEAAQKALTVLQNLVTGPTVHAGWKKRAVEALTGTRLGTVWLLDTHAKGDLPKDLVAQAGQLLRNSPFQGERNRALLLFPAPGKLDPKKLPPISELAKRNGDPARGKQVWNASLAGAAQCAKCHMVRGVGGQVGPDLSMIGKKGGKEQLFESILQPSKAISDQYLQHSVTTTAEQTITGLLVGETPTSITLRDANGKDNVVSKKDIEGAVRKLKVSIMPEDIVAALTEDEMIDLVAYLETLKLAAYTPDTFHIVGPFRVKDMEAALDSNFGPEGVAFDPVAKFRWAADMLPWKTIRPDGKGYFDLAAYHGDKGNNSASYMYTEIESPMDQAGEVLLGPDDGAKLWINGKDVFVTRATAAATPEAHKIPVKLVKGKNTVLLKVANGNNPHGFYFSLTSAEELKPVAK